MEGGPRVCDRLAAMVRPRLVAMIVGIAGCAPHERSQEPSAPCPTGMVEIGDDGPGLLGVAKVCMDLTEVTTAAYAACVQAGVCTPAIVGTGKDCNLTRASQGEHPINCASWEQAQTYCGWLGKRLPDDPEWLWAAQGGAAATPFPWGRTPPDATRACWARAATGTCPVGSHSQGASPAGIVDLIGNVAEWTRGYTGRGRAGADARGRLRGGSHEDTVYRAPIDERVADSARDEPAEAATPVTGMRCVVGLHTPVQGIEPSEWTPVVPTPGGLPPVLAARPTMTRPTRPLANLGVLDRNVDESVWWALGDSAAPLTPAAASTLGLTDHVQMSVKPEALKTFVASRWIGDMLLMTNSSSYDLKMVAVEPATFKLRWQVALGSSGRSYEQIVTPRTLVVLYTGDTNSALIGHALDSGREVWRVRGGAAEAGFTHVKQLWSDDERVFIAGDVGVVAFDANTGVKLWGGVPLGEQCGVATAPGVLVLEDAAGHRVIDPASGATLRRIGAPGACAWAYDAWDGRIPPGAIAGGRLIAFDPPPLQQQEDVSPVRRSTLRAFDLATGAEVWRRLRIGYELLVADQDAVFVQEGETLVAIDAANGVSGVEVSFGSSVYSVAVQPGGGEAGPLVVVDTSDTGQWILGRKPEPTQPESFVIRGRLVPDEMLRKWQAGNVPVEVHGKIVRTGKDGRFEARGRAIGAVAIKLGTTRGPHERGGSHVTFTDRPVILDGSGRYDVGAIDLNEWAMY